MSQDPKTSGPCGAALHIPRLEAVADAARDLIALWKQGKIDGLPRAERNAAIESSRARLIETLEALDGRR